MKKILVPFFLLLVSCCKMHHNTDSIKIEFSNVKDIDFEDCIDSLYINPIYCDYPISELSRIQIYSNCFFMKDAASKIIYYVSGDSVISKLDAFGRGHGEYQSLSSFAYCEEESMLYVFSSVDQKILLYKVPSFEFISFIPFDYIISCMSYEEGSLIAICTTNNNNSVRSNGIYSIDVNNGNVRLLMPLDFFSAYFSYDLSFFHNKGALYFINPCFDNVIFRVTPERVEKVCEYYYGKYNLNKDFFNIDETDSRQYSEKIIELFNSDYTVGGYCGDICDSINFSFWTSVGHSGETDYYRVKVEDAKSYLYRVLFPINSFEMTPDYVYRDWFVRIINKTDIDLTDENRVTGKTVALIEEAFNRKKFDNPVLLFYKLKEKWE